MSADTFVIADAHGNAALVLALLEQEGLVENDVGVWRRTERETSIGQIGDLGNCVAASIQDDCQAYDLVRNELLDWMLVGNHEHPYFGGPAFNGFWPDGEVRKRLLGIRDDGALKAAHAVDDILITHAGLNPWSLGRLADDLSVAGIAQAINGVWAHDPLDPLFSVTGSARGGWERYGGILWADWSEPKPRRIRQIVGHTVGTSVRRRSGAICIDLGGGKRSTQIAGAWIRGGDVKVAIYDSDKGAR